jgi:predicted NUDIX family NTP pyrophosphohydrolase
MKKSAGILLYRNHHKAIEFLLVHPGGPFWKNKDIGAWSIPKGEFNDEEDPLDAAIREFKEETGVTLEGKFIALTPIRQKSGKSVYAWAAENDFDVKCLTSNTCEVQWPPNSGRTISIPEVDRAEWFGYADAVQKINIAQIKLISDLMAKLKIAAK